MSSTINMAIPIQQHTQNAAYYAQDLLDDFSPPSKRSKPHGINENLSPDELRSTNVIPSSDIPRPTTEFNTHEMKERRLSVIPEDTVAEAIHEDIELADGKLQSQNTLPLHSDLGQVNGLTEVGPAPDKLGLEGKGSEGDRRDCRENEAAALEVPEKTHQSNAVPHEVVEKHETDKGIVNCGCSGSPIIAIDRPVPPPIQRVDLEATKMKVVSSYRTVPPMKENETGAQGPQASARGLTIEKACTEFTLQIMQLHKHEENLEKLKQRNVEEQIQLLQESVERLRIDRDAEKQAKELFAYKYICTASRAEDQDCNNKKFLEGHANDLRKAKKEHKTEAERQSQILESFRQEVSLSRSTLENQVKSCRSEIVLLKERLESENSAKSEEVSQLKHQKALLSQELNAKSLQNQSLEAQCRSLETQIQSEQPERVSLQTSVTHILSTLTENFQSVDSILNSMRNVNHEHVQKEVQKVVDGFQEYQESKQSRIDTIHELVQSLEAKYVHGTFSVFILY